MLHSANQSSLLEGCLTHPALVEHLNAKSEPSVPSLTPSAPFCKEPTVKQQISVLLVDDQLMIGEAVRRMLASEEDIIFHHCNSAAQALHVATEVGPTVILQDLIMPDMDGLELVRLFRANPATLNVPLIMLSTKDEPKVKAEAFALGINDYLIKLPDKIELVARIRYHSRAYTNLQAQMAALVATAQAQQLQHTLQELRDTQSQLIQAEKMSSLGQMVAGIAHEINNPVNFISGNLRCVSDYINDLLSLVDLYQEQYPNPLAAVEAKVKAIDLDFIVEDLPKILVSMQVGTQRICEIITALRNFSRLDQADIKPVDIHEGIDSTLLILSYRMKKDIALKRDYGTLPQVECYPAQLNQVFMNIISNAIDALLEVEAPINKQVTVQTRATEREVEIQIQDNGPGIPAEIQAKLFDPFFTTKPVGQGTGLGLAICYKIVQKHRGAIEVISERQQGTTFRIKLPIQQVQGCESHQS